MKKYILTLFDGDKTASEYMPERWREEFLHENLEAFLKSPQFMANSSNPYFSSLLEIDEKNETVHFVEISEILEYYETHEWETPWDDLPEIVQNFLSDHSEYGGEDEWGDKIDERAELAFRDAKQTDYGVL
jgi:hypothetical protein